MHLVDESVGLMGSSSIVGGGIPIGTGLGLAIKMKKEDRVSVVFFGDGAADEGVFYESVNFAILKKLPVIFVLENNQFSVCSRVSARWHGESPFHKIDQGHLLSRKIDGNSVIEVYLNVRDAVTRARSGGGPSFIECLTYRIRGHAGSGDAPPGYRNEQEINEWVSKCPLTSLEKYLKTQSVLNDEEINSMSQRIETELDDAFAFAQKSPLPQQSDVGRFLFKE
jgi:acetoin:2,6-dichlorophenolindophenol oxidoreductase subunit alpha